MNLTHTKHLYMLVKNGGRITVKGLTNCLDELNFDYTVTRRDNGWTTKKGTKSKKPDVIVITYKDHKYSSDGNYELKPSDLADYLFNNDIKYGRELNIHYCEQQILLYTNELNRLLNTNI